MNLKLDRVGSKIFRVSVLVLVFVLFLGVVFMLLDFVYSKPQVYSLSECLKFSSQDFFFSLGNVYPQNCIDQFPAQECALMIKDNRITFSSLPVVCFNYVGRSVPGGGLVGGR